MMARRRTFVPEGLVETSLEARVVLTFLGSVGGWISGQYHHVTQDLGITHKHNNAAGAGISELWKQNDKAQAVRPFHGTTLVKTK